MIPGDGLEELGKELHRRLIGGEDARVTAEIAEAFLPELRRALSKRFFNLPDPHLVETVAEDTLLKYFRNPEKFNPARSSLIAYLYMDARGDLLNLLESSRKDVELFLPVSEYEPRATVAGDDPETLLIEEEIRKLDEGSPIVRRAMAKTADGRDRELLELMMYGVRETEVYARALGIEDQPQREQAAIVKRHKDRLKKALRRAIRRPTRGK